MKKMLLLTVLSVVVFVGCVERKDKEQSSAPFTSSAGWDTVPSILEKINPPTFADKDFVTTIP